MNTELTLIIALATLFTFTAIYTTSISLGTMFSGLALIFWMGTVGQWLILYANTNSYMLAWLFFPLIILSMYMLWRGSLELLNPESRRQHILDDEL